MNLIKNINIGVFYEEIGCDRITILNDGIVQPIKVDQIDVKKELKKYGYGLYDKVPFGVIREIAEDGGLDIIVNQELSRIEFHGAVYDFGGMFEDSFGESFDYDIIAIMNTSKYMKGTYLEDGHLEDICAFAKNGFKYAEFPYGY